MTDLLTTTKLTPVAKSHTAVVLKKFFDVKPGDHLIDFARELKTLSDHERDQLTTGILNESFTY